MSRKKKIKIIIYSSLFVIVVALFIVFLLNSQSNNESSTNIKSENKFVEHKPSDESTIYQGKLPSNKLLNQIPQITVGTIGDVIESPDGVSINVLNVGLQDYQNYISYTQQMGFVNDPQSESSANTILYSAKNNNGVLLRTSYSADYMKMSLVISNE